ncbi:hypothetical protein ACLB2K_006776 [Fragaria x ananassa]
METKPDPDIDDDFSELYKEDAALLHARGKPSTHRQKATAGGGSRIRDIDLATITERMAVKKAVQCGNVEDAIDKMNDLNPEILDTNPQLCFHLQQQRLIELIRNGKVEEALEFAQEELAPRGEENQSFLEELERTVALLAFEDVSNCPVGELLDISQRLKTASEVNAAILTSQSHEIDAADFELQG